MPVNALENRTDSPTVGFLYDSGRGRVPEPVNRLNPNTSGLRDGMTRSLIALTVVGLISCTRALAPERVSGNRLAASRILGISYKTRLNKIAAYGLRRTRRQREPHLADSVK